MQNKKFLGQVLNDMEFGRLPNVTNILVESVSLIPSVKLGVLNVLALFEEKKQCEVRFKTITQITRQDIFWCDIFVCVRGSVASERNLVKAAKAAGRFVVYFIDDDLLNIPEDSLSREFYDHASAKEAILSIMTDSNLLWCVNPLLGKKYSDLCATRYIASDVPMQALDAPEQSMQSCCKVLYAGSRDHFMTVRELLSPAVEKLCLEFEDRISFTFIGINPHIKNDAVKFIEYIDDYDTYKKTVLNGGFQIGLAPIRTNEFYNHKYYNKFLEYTSIGTVGIYTDAPPYTLVIKDKINGFLCDNHPEEWYSAIKEAVIRKELREACLANAVELLKTDFSSTSIYAKFCMDFPEGLTYRAPQISLKSIPYKRKLLVILWRRAMSFLKRNKFKSIPKLIKKVYRMVFKRAHKISKT